jgi:hypothetical protein
LGPIRGRITYSILNVIALVIVEAFLCSVVKCGFMAYICQVYHIINSVGFVILST